MRKTKLFLFLMLAVMGISSMTAQVVTTWNSSLTPVTKDALVASAGTGAKYAFRMPSVTRPGWCDFVNLPPRNDESNYLYDLTSAYLFSVNAGSASGKYWLTRYTDGKSLSGNHAFADTGMDLTLTNRVPSDVSDYDTGFSNSSPYVSFDNASGAHYNCGNGDFRGGTGGWSVYAIYGPFYVVHMVAKSESETILEEKDIVCYDGTVLNAPEYDGYEYASGGDSYTVSGADYNWTIVYSVPSALNYTVNVTYENDVVVPVTISVLGTDITSTMAYSGDPITASDVTATVTDPTYYATTVTISGTTINVYCYDPRWPINFPKTQTYTRSDRHLDGITFESSVVGNQSATGFYNNGTSTLCYQDLTNDATRTITFPAETEVHPNIARTGVWEHGFVYIDLDNNGSFADEGELVSKVNAGNPSLSKDMPNFVMPSTPGTYRMRVKMDWASEDPGGNTDPGNYIIDNGGAIVDLALVITAPVTTTNIVYKVNDSNGTELWASDPQEIIIGEVVSTLPDAYKKGFTSYTCDAPITTVADEAQNVVTFTATFNLPFVPFTDFENATWYSASLRGTKYLKYDSTTEPYSTNNSYAETDEYMWAFKGNPYTGIEVYNKATGEGKTLTTVDAGDYPIAVMRDGVQRWTIQQGATYTDGFLLLDEAWASNAYINDNGNTLRFWTNNNAVNDNGSTWRVITPAAKRLNELKAAVATLSATNCGLDYGQFSFTGDMAKYNSMITTLIPDLLTAANAAITSENPASVAEQLSAVQTVLANLAFNVPVDGSAFRIKSTHDTYLTGNVSGEGSSARYLFQTDADASTIWFLKNGMLYNYTTGEAFKGRGDATTVTEFGIEAATGEEGKYVVRFHPGNNTRRWLWAWNPDHATNANKADQNGSEAANTRFSLEAVTEIPVEVSEALHATLFLPVGVQAVDGMTLNGVTSKGNDYLTLESVAKVAANTPVVVKAEAAGTYNLPVVTDGVTVEGNLLTGVAVGGETIDAEVNAYILGKDELGVGFFPLSATDRALKSWKAYYVPASETSARAFYFDDVTGLNKVLNTTEGAIYDLSGRRVEKAQKGLYIVNGKKVLVK